MSIYIYLSRYNVMKRSTMIYLEQDYLKKIKEIGVENISPLINTLLSKYIAEAEFKEDKKKTYSFLPEDMTVEEFENNKKKSEEALSRYKKEKAEAKIHGD